MMTTGKNLVFLLGAGRSGTTLLYKLLSLHPDVGYVSNYDSHTCAKYPTSLLSRAVAPWPHIKRGVWYKQKGNAYFMQRPLFKKIFPTPVEGEEIYSDCGLPESPPTGFQLTEQNMHCLRERFGRMMSYSGAQVFISKRTSNNQRLPWLAQAFPDAKYINLIRDGRAVAHSLAKVEWWNDHQVWWAGKTPVELEKEGLPSYEICARNWVEDVQVVRSGLSLIDPSKVIELRYEDLMKQPALEIERLLRFLQLSPDGSFTEAWQSLGLHQGSDGWRKAWSDDAVEGVNRIQHELLNTLGYEP